MLVTVFVFFGSIFVLNAVGLFRITVPTVASVQESENYLKIVDLRGSMPIEVGAFYTGMELSEFYAVMEIPETVPPQTLLKDVVRFVPGYDFHVVKARK